MKKENLSGQALLFVLLSMAVVTTLVLSTVSRSISDIELTTTEEDSLRAFSAAEAGIENALLGTLNSGTVGNATYTITTDSIGENQYYNYPFKIAPTETAIVWFMTHDATSPFTGDTVKVCWGDENFLSNQVNTPAIEVTVLYDDSALKIIKTALDPNSTRASGTGFAAPNAGTCTVDDGNESRNYAFSNTINFVGLGMPAGSDLKLISIRLLYNDTNQPVGIKNSFMNFPSQGSVIESVGSSGNASRKVEVYSLYGTLPSLFETALATTSSGGITQ